MDISLIICDNNSANEFAFNIIHKFLSFSVNVNYIHLQEQQE